jgi:hypothetical protein
MKLVPEREPLARLLAFCYVTIAGLVWLVFTLWGRPIERLVFCPLRDNFGLPCPTCGGTHAALALVRGDLGEALWHNPLVVIATLLLVMWTLYAIAATLHPRWRRQIQLNAREWLILRIAAILFFAGNWAYEIIRLT